MTFEEYIDKREFKYFKGYELARYADRWRGNVKNDLPPRSVWKNIIPTLRVADDARERLGSPIMVTSSYRSPNYNSAVGGVAHSQHMVHTALDLIPRHTSPQELFNVLWQMRQEGVFKGGLGLYRTFVHVDTRGRNATWG